jgi:hypothetical protein
MIAIDFIVGVGISIAIEIAGLLAMIAVLVVIVALWEAMVWLLR